MWWLDLQTVPFFSQLRKHFIRSADRSQKNLSQGKTTGDSVQLEGKGCQVCKEYLMLPSAAVSAKTFPLLKQNMSVGERVHMPCFRHSLTSGPLLCHWGCRTLQMKTRNRGPGRSTPNCEGTLVFVMWVVHKQEQEQEQEEVLLVKLSGSTGYREGCLRNILSSLQQTKDCHM